MAIIIPKNPKKFDSPGESTVLALFRKHLPEDWIVYYNPKTEVRQVDLIVFVPNKGLLILEIKDYSDKTQIEVDEEDPNFWKIKGPTMSVVSSTQNPFSQAKDCMWEIVNILNKDSYLIHTEGKYLGKLKLGYSYGVIFTKMSEVNLHRLEDEGKLSDSVWISSEYVSERYTDFSADRLIDKLLSMFHPFAYATGLTEQEIGRIRYHLFPEVRIKKYSENELKNRLTLEAMDLYQETLAKEIAEGHRIIRGVAGSGKTIILQARVFELIKQHSDWKILVLCFNRTLAASINSAIKDKLITDKVEVTTVNNWAKKYKIYSLGHVSAFLEKNKDTSLELYDAILIDETQDLEKEWFDLILRFLNPKTKSLLLMEDRAQSVYKGNVSLASSTGLDFRGRSTILRVNYRNTRKILELALFVYNKLSPEDVKSNPDLIAPEFSSRVGREPVIESFKTFQEEMDWVCRNILSLVRKFNISFNQIAILYQFKRLGSVDYINIIHDKLLQYGIDIDWVTENKESKSSFDYKSKGVKVLTYLTSKGLGFPVVFVVGSNTCPSRFNELEKEVSLFYIALTRAQNLLYVSMSGVSKISHTLMEYKEENRK